MPSSNAFVVTSRFASLAIILAMASTLDVNAFSYKAVFIGLLFSHFAMGFVYSKANMQAIAKQKSGLMVALFIMAIGIVLAITVPTTAKYYLVFHAALSDAYLLTLLSRRKDGENLALARSLFYSACFALLIIDLSIIASNALMVLASISLIWMILQVRERGTLILFEAPLVAITAYAFANQITFPFHFLGFYHILTWYVFSFWMLTIKERNPKKTAIFFSQIGVLSAAFVMLFSFAMGYDITDVTFLQVVGAFSILHIFSTIPLSKFNPRAIKQIFYPEAGRSARA